ncbi:MAG: hypothetical protein AB4911_24935 [Oscillochloridaceae bacterium umkhey_bin13]
MLADEGWDPYLVSAAGRWLMHWQIAGYNQPSGWRTSQSGR